MAGHNFLFHFFLAGEHIKDTDIWIKDSKCAKTLSKRSNINGGNKLDKKMFMGCKEVAKSKVWEDFHMETSCRKNISIIMEQ